MKFGKSVLSPSYFTKHGFDSLKSIDKSFSFDCLNCRSKIVVEYSSIIGKEYSWHDDFSEENYDEIKKFYEMNAAGKTPDGSLTGIYKCRCDVCDTQYLIYSGVSEYYNSLYKITLQGITEIFENE